MSKHNGKNLDVERIYTIEMIVDSFLLWLLLTATNLIGVVVVAQGEKIGSNSFCSSCFCHHNGQRPSFVAKKHSVVLPTAVEFLKPCNAFDDNSHGYHRREWTIRSRTFLKNHKERGEQEDEHEYHNDPVYNNKKEERSQWLCQRLGLSQAQLAKLITTAPFFLNARSETLNEKFNWMERRLDLKTPKQLTKLVLATPGTFSLNMPNNVGPKLDLIQNRIECTNVELVRLIETSPRVTLRSIDKIVEVLDVLETDLRIETAQDLRVLVLGGGALIASSATTLKPRIVWFQRTLQVDDDEDDDSVAGATGPTKLGKLLRHHGGVLTFDTEKTLEPKVQWLKQRLNATDEEAAYLLRCRIQILQLHMESTLESKFSWLMNRYGLKDTTDLKRMLLALPSIVGYNHVKNIEPKLTFYEELLGDKQKTNQFVTRDPRFLSYSLENRIKPRVEQAEEIGMKINPSTLNNIIKATDERWSRAVSNHQRKAAKELSEGGGL